MLLVQKYLQSHSLEDLESEYHIYAKWDKDRTKFSLNYDQIFAQQDCPLTRQCRGLILRPSCAKPIDPKVFGNTQVLAYPMDRFFNYGQEAADKIRWNVRYEIQAKLDGTLCIVYWDHLKNRFCVATRSVPEADIPLNDSGLTFYNLFRQTVEDEYETWGEFCSWLNKSRTYCFELTTPMNQVVVQHPNANIHFLAVRDLQTYFEMAPIDDVLTKRFEEFLAPKFYRMTIDQIVEFVNAKPGHEFEGVVVCQNITGEPSFKRLKIKNADYLMLNRQLDIFSSKRNMLKFCLSENYDDVSANVNEKFKATLNELRESALNFFLETDKRFEEIKNTKEQKDFALKMNDQDWSACLFDKRKAWRKEEHLGTLDWVLSKKKNGEIPTQIVDQILKRIEK